MSANTIIALITASLLSLGIGCKKTQKTDSNETEPWVSSQEDVGVVFCHGFEDGNFSVWDDFDGNPEPDNVLLEHPGPFNKPGNHVMRLRVKEGRGSSDVVKMLPNGPYDKLYARWYAYWEDGYDISARNHGSGFGVGGRNFLGVAGNRPKGDDYASAWVEPDPKKNGKLNIYSYYRGMYQNCANPVGSCWGDTFPCMASGIFCTNTAHAVKPDKTPPDLQTGKWYCIELLMDLGKPSADGKDATGVLNMWIDGVEYGPWDKLWMRTTEKLSIQALWLQLFHHEDHSIAGMYFDDVVVSTRRIGVDQANCN